MSAPPSSGLMKRAEIPRQRYSRSALPLSMVTTLYSAVTEISFGENPATAKLRVAQSAPADCRLAQMKSSRPPQVSYRSRERQDTSRPFVQK
jgi:hypothetical protein